MNPMAKPARPATYEDLMALPEHVVGEIIDGEVMIETHREAVRELCIPVRHRGHTVGVLARESAPTIGRPPGELERTYVEVFNRFARMIASGEFPFGGAEALSEEAPRVGDGVILLDEMTKVEYTPSGRESAARPNARMPM